MSKNNNEINLTTLPTSELNSLLETTLENLDTARKNKDRLKFEEFDKKVAEIIAANPNSAFAWCLERKKLFVLDRQIQLKPEDVDDALAFGLKHNLGTLIHLAIKYGAKNVMGALDWGLEHANSNVICIAMEKKANPNIPLAWALERNNSGDVNVILTAIKHGAEDIKGALTWTFEHTWEPDLIREFGYNEKPDLLLELGIERYDIDIVIKSLESGAKNVNDALKFAITKRFYDLDMPKSIKLIDLAIEKGADVNLVEFVPDFNIVGGKQKDPAKLTAACVAIQYREYELFEKIVKNPNYNINAANIKDGIRLIDFVQELEWVELSVIHDKINILRKNGSFEPQQFIGDSHKIDVTVTHSADGYEPNVINAPKILKLLYKKYLTNTPDVAEIIKKFKDCCNKEIDSKKIADMIAHQVDSFTSKDNYTENRYFMHNQQEMAYTVKWESKKALAAVILACDQDPFLKARLLIVLSDLEKCALGQLINLLNIAQHALPKESILREGADINGCIDYVISNSSSKILTKEKELFLFCQKMLYKNFTNIDILNQNITHIDIQKILSVFNSKLIEIVTDSLKPEYKNKIIPSECFIELHNYLAKLSEDLVINKQNLSAAEKQLAESYLTGADQYFTEKLIGAADRIKDEPKKNDPEKDKEREIIKFFDNISINLEFNCGKLFGLSEASIKKLFNVVAEKKGINFAKEFMELLIKNVDLSDGVEEFAAHLIKAEYILGEDNIVLTADHTQIIGSHITDQDEV